MNRIACMLLLCAGFTLAQDLSKVQMKVTKVAGTVYMLEGAGGNEGLPKTSDDHDVRDVARCGQ